MKRVDNLEYKHIGKILFMPFSKEVKPQRKYFCKFLGFTLGDSTIQVEQNGNIIKVIPQAYEDIYIIDEKDLCNFN